MKIEKDTVVTLKYKVSDAQGKLLEAAEEPMAYLHGGYENTLPKIEEALEGQAKGYQTTLVLSAADAFGERDESLLQTMPKKDFPPGVKVGGRRMAVKLFSTSSKSKVTRSCSMATTLGLAKRFDSN
jgi:FKBP-type peptidyl-prolyl cis-trans isomerase SlyD